MTGNLIDMVEPPAGKTIVVIPCFNEAARLDVERLKEFNGSVPDRLLLVDDGSSDDTWPLIESLVSSDPAYFQGVRLETNVGKAEAVRRGLLAAIDDGAEFMGFWDADLATPLEDIPYLHGVFAGHQGIDMVFGSRVRMMGTRIDRSAIRHYIGRMFATVVSWMLKLPIYDTQCGAKLFRVTPITKTVFAKPFETRWLFDVEILARYLRERGKMRRVGDGIGICERPLSRWEDVAGSKVKPRDFVKALVELARIYRVYVWRSRLPRLRSEEVAFRRTSDVPGGTPGDVPELRVR